jgi:TonB family protein
VSLPFVFLASGIAGAEDPRPSGMITRMSDPELLGWVERVRGAVGPYWVPPLAACEQDLVVGIEVDVDGKGAPVSPPKVDRTSGVPEFDLAALRAVEAVDAFPPPPPRYATGVVTRLRFSSRDCR